MGLTRASVGLAAAGKREGWETPAVALAGNPNVGKSTLFNSLTGLRQHTGNWPGKTVCLAQGRCRNRDLTLVDLPGTYSLLSHSPEEQVARSYLCSGKAERVIVVCDGTTLERNLVLVLQILEITPKVLVCVNLLDEARRKGIQLDLPLLSKRLGVPVVGVAAREKRSAAKVLSALDRQSGGEAPLQTAYPSEIEAALEKILPTLPEGSLPRRFLALKLLEGDPAMLEELSPWLHAEALEAARQAREALAQTYPGDALTDALASAGVRLAARVAQGVVRQTEGKGDRDRRIDRILTSRYFGYPAMLALLALVFWLTIVGTNYISSWLQSLLNEGETLLTRGFTALGAPDWLHGLLILGGYRTTAWVCAVMLPPMAIFFPLFTLLEDAGYLPRVAYLLDRPFQCCRGCGKQALSMCMGLGCNAAGVVGCRIIDSPRERLLAVLTNSFMPCNGRFPLIITLLTLFAPASLGALGQAALLTMVIVFSVAVTLGVTWCLSRTLLRGKVSAFALELPPYRVPQVGSVLLRSVLDRTVFVLGRALAVACPAGMLLWGLANVRLPGGTLLTLCAGALEPLGRIMGLDGVLLLSFLLGFPANEIVLPIALMGYLGSSSLTAVHTEGLLEILLAQGWTWKRAGSMLLFTLLHWPCSTTLLTIRKETGSLRWTALAALLPTAIGFFLCCLLTAVG